MLTYVSKGLMFLRVPMTLGSYPVLAFLLGDNWAHLQNCNGIAQAEAARSLVPTAEANFH